MKNFLVQHYLNNTSLLFPDKTAIYAEDQSISYRQYDTRSNQLARILVEQGIKRQDRVIICLPRTTHFMISIFGILKADAIYVPVDNDIPSDRLLTIINDSQPSAVIFDETSFNKYKDIHSVIPDCSKMIIDHESIKIHESDAEITMIEFKDVSEAEIQCSNIDTDVAYILYTSGSTGLPKGVMISHLNIINYISWGVDYFSITENDNILSTAPFHFDMSTFDIYCAVESGATLALASKKNLLFPGALFDLIERQGVTIWKGVASLLMYIARSGILKKGRIPTLSRIIFGGEVLPAKYVVDWMQVFPDKAFFNGYGPTEATGLSTCFRVNEMPHDNSGIIPIGEPCSNTDCFILDKEGNEVEPGAKGDLYIRGSGLSPGYWNDEEATRKAFLEYKTQSCRTVRMYKTGDIARFREDGNIEFICREDDQIKFMGYRIELSDIEKALLSLNGVNDAAALLYEATEYSVSEIIAYIEAENSLNENDIKEELKTRLPIYMIPKKLILLDKLPRTDRGKISKTLLRKELKV